ncbi:MAG: hypothetical protein Q8M96_03175, partial [Rubrivivax sp.]|nr:hypothetical protein [Rubrivivax sp.]
MKVLATGSVLQPLVRILGPELDHLAALRPEALHDFGGTPAADLVIVEAHQDLAEALQAFPVVFYPLMIAGACVHR